VNPSAYTTLDSTNIGYTLTSATGTGYTVNSVASNTTAKVLNSITLNKGVYLATMEVNILCTNTGTSADITPVFNLREYNSPTQTWVNVPSPGGYMRLPKSFLLTNDNIITSFQYVLKLDNTATYRLENVCIYSGGTYTIKGNISAVKIL
jgi:hypothetical protein